MSGTDYTTTPNLGLFKPNYDMDDGQWGFHLNTNADKLDTALSTGAGGMFLPLTGGSVSGPINVTVTGTPVARSVQDSLADAVNVKSFGAIMDGASHPLSSKYGSLGAAQAVYPHATSLTDEIDWCAIQGAVNAGNVAIRIPAGIALINKPIVSSTANIAVIGEGVDVATIIQTAAGQDGWQHNSTAHFQMFGVNLKCNGTGGIALNLNFAGNVANLTLRDVFITGNGNQTTNYWHDGIISIGPGLIVIDNVNVVGINQGDLSLVGNGIYIAPRVLPTHLGCFQIAITNAGVSYWQNAIVFDSSAATNLGNNIQGVILDWINAVSCMQFVKVLGTQGILELVIHKCQNASFGAAINVTNAVSVVVRDSYFIGLAPIVGRSIAAQLPQDMFYLINCSTWWIKDNRFQINNTSVWNYVFNLQGTTVAVAIRDNAVTANGATLSGYINIASGVTAIQESGSALSFFTAPKITNGNTNGGAANLPTLGALATSATLISDLWQQAGSFVGFNYTAGRNATDFINSHGNAAFAGGFYFYNVASDPAATPTLLAEISNNGIFTCNGLIAKSAPIGGTAYTIAATDSSLVLNPTGTFTLTLGSATAGNTGRIIWLKLIAAFAVNSAAANVVPVTGGAATAAILPATAGKWCVLQSDGTSWQIMMAN